MLNVAIYWQNKKNPAINQSVMAQLIFYYSTVDVIQKYGVHMKKQFEQQETWQTFTNMQ